MHHVSATPWAIRLRARKDLRVRASTDQKLSTRFNVLDPLTRQSYRVGDLERALLYELNGRRTLSHVLKQLRGQKQFAGLEEQQLLATVANLQRIGLVRATTRSTDKALSPTATKAVQAQQVLSGFVVWQVRGLQPDAWLAKLSPHVDWIFSGAAVRFWILIALMTSCGVLLEFQRLASQSASWQWILQPVQGTALFIVFLCTRALHEVGHALVCKRHGIRCPDIGLFLILGAPCVYCDVSESWQLPSRWQRAAVAAAGMYVELILATLAAWVWLVTIDGPANTVALQTMFVCSVSTVLINANPLMRFDGYYILSDVLDEANLRGRADGLAESRLLGWILGRPSEPSTVAERSLYGMALCGFSWLGWMYRAGLALAIAGLLVTIYDSWNLAWIGRLIAGLILFSWWGVPSLKLVSKLLQMARTTKSLAEQGTDSPPKGHSPVRMGSKTGWRLSLVAASAVLCICLLPVPYRQFATGWVQPANMQGVYASAPGMLDRVDMPPVGTLVSAGQPLFRIHDVRTQQEAVRTAAVKRIAELQLEAQLRNMHLQDKLPIDLASATAAVATAAQQAAVAQQELERLLLKAPCDGRLLVMPATPPTGPWSLEAEALKYSWNSATQVGRNVPEGTLLATICGPQLSAVIPLSDKQLEWVASGTEVRVRCSERPAAVATCRVQAVVLLADATATWRLMNSDVNDAVPVASNPRGNGSAAYAALIELPRGLSASTGTRIDGVFVSPSQTIATLVYRWLQQNLRWLAD